MAEIKAADGQTVTDEMIARWSDALDRDEWPKGWRNVGGVVRGRPPLSVEGSTVLSVKVPTGLKMAIEREAKAEGVTSSELVRSMLASALLDKELTAV
jgi:hypothetical protein